MRVLGIDPGTAIVGYGILDYKGNNFEIVDYGCIFTDKNLPMEDRLLEIFKRLDELIKKYSPTHMAIEDLFFFKNNKTIISVGQARGVIVLTGKLNNIPMTSYTPLQVKMGITGYGKAEKKQVQLMVQKLLKLKEIPKPDDAADALAIAITHINSLSNLQSSLQKMETVSFKDVKKDKISAKEFRELFIK
jgi:crossover junction endodeoxyribonuclease RuvC